MTVAIRRREILNPTAVHRHFQPETEIVQLRAKPAAVADGDGMTFEGHAAVFNLPTYIGPPKQGFYEQVAPGAFAKALRANADVRAVLNHDPNMLLGRTTAGTLRLSEDDHGLYQQTDLPNTSVGRDVSELIRRRDITGQSFQFTVARESWSAMPGGHSQLRTVQEVGSLIDVGPVTYPAYADTTASVRSEIFPSRELRDGVVDYGLVAMVAATDAALDAATDAVAAGSPEQAKALLSAAASTIDQAAYSLWSIDTDLLQSLGLPDIPALVQSVDSAIDAAVSAIGDPDVLAGANAAVDALMDALHIDDPDRGEASASGATEDENSRGGSSWVSTDRLLLEGKRQLLGVAA